MHQSSNIKQQYATFYIATKQKIAWDIWKAFSQQKSNPKRVTEDPSLNFDQWVQFEAQLSAQHPQNIIKEKSQSAHGRQVFIKMVQAPPYYLRPFTEKLYETVLKRLKLIYAANDKQVLLRERQDVQISEALIQIADLLDIAAAISQILIISEFSPFQNYHVFCSVIFNVLNACGHKYVSNNKQSRKKPKRKTVQTPNLLQEIYEEADQLPGNSSSSFSETFQETLLQKPNIYVHDLSDDERIQLYSKSLDIQQLQDLNLSQEETILTLYVIYDLQNAHFRLKIMKDDILRTLNEAFNYFLIDKDPPFRSVSGENFPSSGILPFQGITSIIGLLLSIPGHNYASTFFLRLYQYVFKFILLKPNEMLQLLGLVYFILDSHNATITLENAGIDINEEVLRQVLYFFPDLELKDRLLILDIVIQCCDSDNFACKQSFNIENPVNQQKRSGVSKLLNIEKTISFDSETTEQLNKNVDLSKVTLDDKTSMQALWMMGGVVAALFSFKARIIKQLGEIGECSPQRFIREMSGIKIIQLLFMEFAPE